MVMEKAGIKGEALVQTGVIKREEKAEKESEKLEAKGQRQDDAFN